MPSIYDGPSGDSLFHEPYPWIDSTPWWNDNVVPLFAKIQKTDDRSTALMAALVLETRLDALLTLWMPGFPALAADRDFSLSMKLKLLKASRLIPRKICNAADRLRLVRNEFAPNLALESFDQLKKGCIQAMRTACEPFRFPGKDGWVDSSSTPRQIFDVLTSHAVSGLYAFEANLRSLRQAVTAPNFEARLGNESQEMFYRDAVALAKQGSGS